MKSKLYMILSMTIFGTIGIFRRLIPLSSGELSLYRAVLAAVLILGYFLIKREKLDFSKIKKALVLLVISGAAMGFNWIFLFEAYNYTSVSIATMSYYFAPILVTILSPFIFKEKLTLKNALCFVFATVGLVLVVFAQPENFSKTDFLGIAFGLLAAVLYASVILLNKAIKDLSGIVRTFLQFLSAIVVLLPYVFITSGINLSVLNKEEIFLLCLVGFVHTGVTYCLYFSSLHKLSGSTCAILSYIDPLVAVICSVVLLQEPLGILQAVGGVMILGFTLLSEIQIKKTSAKC